MVNSTGDINSGNNLARNLVGSPTGPWQFAAPINKFRNAFEIDGAPVPEPGTLLLLGTGLLGVVGAARRKWLG
jgi:hypothetical protein